MAELEVDLPTGRVVGRFIVEVQDNADPGEEPQLIPATGEVIIKSSIDHLEIYDPALGDFVTFRGPHRGVLDSEGRLSTLNPDLNEPMYTDMVLWSNDSDKMSVKGWTYTATFNLKTLDGRSLNLPAVTFELATGQEYNLARGLKAPSSPGYGLPQAEAAALRAEGAALASAEGAALAVEAAGRAELVAGATDAGVAILLGDSGTETGALLEHSLALKADLTEGKVPDDQIPAGVTSSLNDLAISKADRTEVESALTFKASKDELNDGLRTKADSTKLADVAPERGVRAVGKGELIVNAADYLNADGVTDDGLLLRNLLNSLPAKARVLLPDKRMLINQIVSIPKPVKLIGGDIRSTHSGPALWVRSGGVSMEDLSVEGNGSGTYDGSVSLIRANGTLAAPFVGLHFHGIKLKGSQGSGLRVEYSVGATLERVEVDGFVYMGIQFLSVTDGKIDRANIKNVNHNASIGNSYGISCSDDQNTDAARTRHVTISRSMVDGMKDWVGIETHGGYDIRVNDNTVTNCASGIAMATGASSRNFAPERVNVYGNYIEYGGSNVQRGGLRLQGRAGGPQASGIMRGNTMVGYTNPTIFADYDDAKSDVTGNVTA